MAEPTQEQLMNYISAAMEFYARVRGRGYAPTNKQLHELLAACGVHVALKRIETDRDSVDELEQEEETPPGDDSNVLLQIIDELFSIAAPGSLKNALWQRYQLLLASEPLGLRLSNEDMQELLTVLNVALSDLETAKHISRDLEMIDAIEEQRQRIRKWIHRLSQHIGSGE